MLAKSIGSTEVQNNFGKVIDSAIQEGIIYIINRRGISQAVLLSLQDLTDLLGNNEEGSKIARVLNEVGPTYNLGRSVDEYGK